MLALNYFSLKDQTFYKKLSYLFYAVAAADGKVRLSEITTLHKVINTKWFTNEQDKGAMNTILNTFEHLKSDSTTAEFAFGEFRDYFMQNKQLFTNNLKSRISETTADIAAAFAGNNKSELTYLAQLYLLMN